MTRDELLKDVMAVMGGAKAIIEEGREYKPVLLLLDFPARGDATPILFANGMHPEERTIARRSAELAAATGGSAVLFSSEVWGAFMKATKGEDPQKPKDPEAARLMQMASERRLHEHPGRREFLMVTAAARGANITKMWEIVRDDQGKRRLADGPAPEPDQMIHNYFTDDLPWPSS